MLQQFIQFLVNFFKKVKVSYCIFLIFCIEFKDTLCILSSLKTLHLKNPENGHNEFFNSREHKNIFRKVFQN